MSALVLKPAYAFRDLAALRKTRYALPNERRDGALTLTLRACGAVPLGVLLASKSEQGCNAP